VGGGADCGMGTDVGVVVRVEGGDVFSFGWTGLASGLR